MLAFNFKVRSTSAAEKSRHRRGVEIKDWLRLGEDHILVHRDSAEALYSRRAAFQLRRPVRLRYRRYAQPKRICQGVVGGRQFLERPARLADFRISTARCVSPILQSATSSSYFLRSSCVNDVLVKARNISRVKSAISCVGLSWPHSARPHLRQLGDTARHFPGP